MNPYATRLQEFQDFVFNGQAISQHRAKWKDFFFARMGRNPSKIILEIGCSNAFYLCDVARQNPEFGFVGIDWKYKILYKGAKKSQREELTNLALLRCRAQLLPEIFGPGELDEIWIFFPDPWAKTGQLKHRIFQEDFLLQAHKALKPKGRIYFKTDHPGYFQWAMALMGEEVPELPEWKEKEREIDPDGYGRRARQIKVRKTEHALLPDKSAALQKAFKLQHATQNYWDEKTKRPKATFGDQQTLFEKLFVKDELPIYYLELHKK